MEPMDAGPVTVAILDDTCGNLIQIASIKLISLSGGRTIGA